MTVSSDVNPVFRLDLDNGDPASITVSNPEMKINVTSDISGNNIILNGQSSLSFTVTDETKYFVLYSDVQSSDVFNVDVSVQ